MNKFLVATLAAATALVSMPVQAAHYLGTYLSTNAAAPFVGNFSIFTSDTVNGVGGYDVLSIAGDVDGDAIAALTPNPGQPNTTTSVDGQFYFDNVLFPAGVPFVTNSGLLFTTVSGVEYNLFSDSATVYELYSAVNGAQAAHSVGTFALAEAVPEPASWALMLVGFGAMGAAMRRRKVDVTYA